MENFEENKEPLFEEKKTGFGTAETAEQVDPAPDTVNVQAEPEVKPVAEPALESAVEPAEPTETAPEPVNEQIEQEAQPEKPDTTPLYNESVTAPAEATPFNRINYTEQKPIEDYSSYNKGLKVFCAALAIIILLVAACSGGYFLGRNSNRASFYKNDVKLDLAAKPQGEDGMTAAQVYQEINPSIVGIRVYNSTAAYDASGVVYTQDGYIITNDHIYSSVGAPKFKIYTYDGTEYDAEYVAGDSISDIGLLKIKDMASFKVPQFGNSDEIYCGENVYAVSRQSDASDATAITSGIITVTSRRVKTQTNYASRLIQTDSAINPGSSGGALVNMYGQVIGITSSKLLGEEYDRIGFAIPTTTVKRVVDQLISSGKVTDRAKLGITYNEINSVTKQRENRAATGLLIVSVSSDSDLYGKLSKDDIITHINGIQIDKDDVVLDVLETLKAGDTVRLTVLSPSGDESEISAKLGANTGESSYMAEESKTNNSSSEKDNSSESDDGSFDFPFGE